MVVDDAGDPGFQHERQQDRGSAVDDAGQLRNGAAIIVENQREKVRQQYAKGVAEKDRRRQRHDAARRRPVGSQLRAQGGSADLRAAAAPIDEIDQGRDPEVASLVGAERKHGGPAQPYAWLSVLVDDEPGQIAQLLTEIGEIGVNLEDLRLDHSSGRNAGIVEISVLPAKRDVLIDELAVRGWKVLQ